MSKQKKRKMLGSTRQTWHINPVTRVKKSKKAYNRQRDKKQVERSWRNSL